MVSHIEYISIGIAKLDVITSKTFVAMKYNYCRPSISTECSKSFFNAKQMRHCLIEHIQTNEPYVANDLCMGEHAPKGILLYGTNAVGKTSLIRAIGICMVMAQAGMYVPCDTFEYYPYTSIYTRILGNDNLFKNLSTFAVEMSELRVILNHADESSLVLGDELCSGTETESALSIFMAGLIHLHKQGTTFMFATHFHEIVRFEELKQLTSVVLKHLTVYYDRALDCLVYDRILKDGSGDKMYGLEVAKSLHLPKDFIELAYTIRTTYFPVGGNLSDKQTKYNSNKLIGICELCKGTLATETHHIQEQAQSNPGGYIHGMYKHHPANLVGLCNRCHKLQHNGMEEKMTIKKKTTAGYKRV
jgi:DNA mismatch repair protein MutS